MRHGSGSTLGGLAGALLAAGAGAQTVEMRIVERQGQGYMPWPPQASALLDNQLNFAVQSRVVGGTGIGIRSLSFNVIAACERDSWGTLDRLLISGTDGSMVSNPNQGVSNVPGQGGLASQFGGLLQTRPGAIGWLNASGDGYVNNLSAQDIGGIRALAQGVALVRAVDLDRDGIPDTSSLNGMEVAVPDGATAALDREVAQTYFGADGNWVDVYRFRYTKTGFGGCPAKVEFGVEPVGAPTLFDTMQRVGGVWTAQSVAATGVHAGSVIVTHCTGGMFCVADHDGSGQLDANDLFMFINDWFEGCSGAGGFWCSTRSADVDCNGVLTSQDIFLYLELWFAGC
jgi:hypothetical protein